MNTTCYQLLDTSLACSDGAAIAADEVLTVGKLAVNLSCEWPSDIDPAATRAWTVVDNRTDLAVATEYRSPSGELLRRNVELLIKPKIESSSQQGTFS